MKLVNPKVEVKNVKFHEGHDGTGLNADIFINGKKIAHVYDGAFGGEFEYTAYEPIKENYKMLEALKEYVDTLPEIDGTFGKMKMNLDIFIDEIIAKAEKEKLQKKAKKKMLFAMLIGEDLTSFATLKFKHDKPLSAIPLPLRQKIYDEAKKRCKGKEKVLNTNLKELGIVE